MKARRGGAAATTFGAGLAFPLTLSLSRQGREDFWASWEANSRHELLFDHVLPQTTDQAKPCIPRPFSPPWERCEASTLGVKARMRGHRKDRAHGNNKIHHQRPQSTQRPNPQTRNTPKLTPPTDGHQRPQILRPLNAPPADGRRAATHALLGLYGRGAGARHPAAARGRRLPVPRRGHRRCHRARQVDGPEAAGAHPQRGGRD